MSEWISSKQTFGEHPDTHLDGPNPLPHSDALLAHTLHDSSLGPCVPPSCICKFGFLTSCGVGRAARPSWKWLGSRREAESNFHSLLSRVLRHSRETPQRCKAREGPTTYLPATQQGEDQEGGGGIYIKMQWEGKKDMLLQFTPLDEQWESPRLLLAEQQKSLLIPSGFTSTGK